MKELKQNKTNQHESRGWGSNGKFDCVKYAFLLLLGADEVGLVLIPVNEAVPWI